MSAFDHYLQAVLVRAAEEARAESSATVEAHHVLLALAAGHDPVLAEAGLDRDALREALDREFAHSLAAAGVTLPPTPPRSTPAPGSPGLGSTAKAALDRGFAHAARKKDARPAHVLLGILLAEAGTVPRALALAGIDRQALIERLR
ncbi:MAG: Clp protease N-terminal domain-containing protein [Actinoplanes sp.]